MAPAANKSYKTWRVKCKPKVLSSLVRLVTWDNLRFKNPPRFIAKRWQPFELSTPQLFKMNKKTRINLISICLIAIYFIVFLFMIDDTCVDCVDILWTLYFVPTMTLSFLGYDGQSDVVVWSVILVEMFLLFLLVKWIISLVTKNFG